MPSENGTDIDNDDMTLDRLLHDWSEQATDAGRLNDLRNRIVSSLTTMDAEQAVTVARQTTEPQPRRSAGMSSIAVASVALLLVSIMLFPLRHSDVAVSHPQLPPDYAWLRDDQLQNKAALLAAMEETFDGHLNWLAETGDDVKLGLTASTSTGDGQPDGYVRMAVRIVVERRSPDTSTWQVAWAVDVLAREEEVVNTHGNDGALKLWAYQLPDGHIAIDTEITLTGANALHANSSRVQHDRQPVRIVDEHDSDVEYRVFQTVAVLDREVT